MEGALIREGRLLNFLDYQGRGRLFERGAYSNHYGNWFLYLYFTCKYFGIGEIKQISCLKTLVQIFHQRVKHGLQTSFVL